MADMDSFNWKYGDMPCHWNYRYNKILTSDECPDSIEIVYEIKLFNVVWLVEDFKYLTLFNNRIYYKFFSNVFKFYPILRWYFNYHHIIY